jgi:hypothetical protein
MEGFELLNGVLPSNRNVSGVYSCDLLSWVMSKGKKDNMWVTVQVHTNILAVAGLLDLSCIVIPEGIEVGNDVVSKAEEEGVALISSDLSSYDIFRVLYEAGLK